MKVSTSSLKSDSPHPQTGCWPKIRQLMLVGAIALTGLTVVVYLWERQTQKIDLDAMHQGKDGTGPLIMQGGDPYIRALMRTISASEASDRSPYTIIYGGEHVTDLSQHPNRCVAIVRGPNRGKCSTAAGRYQMLNTTWKEKAKRYHPSPPGMMFWKPYSFAPQYQDAVVHAWLSDSRAWRGTDISQMLRNGQLTDVQRLLSGTWTSLGYGIETNSLTARLPKVYRRVLQEELAEANVQKPSSATLNNN
jgi:muramidase (phage lysozyme)